MAIFEAGSAGKYSTNSIYPNITVTLAAFRRVFISKSNLWQTVTNTFVANSDHTTVEIAGNSANSMLLDDISFVALPATNFNNYFMPEESLEPFTGQNPQGCWTLDVWDTRNDAPVGGAQLLSWTLDMTFSSTNVNLIVLTNHVPYTNTAPLPYHVLRLRCAVHGPLCDQYPLEHCRHNASEPCLQSNHAAGGWLAGELHADFGRDQRSIECVKRGGRPTAAGAGDALLPWRAKRDARHAWQFVLQVDTDVTTNGVIGLTNEVAFATNNNFKLGQFYSFEVPPGATAATFQLSNIVGGDVFLYARYGLPLPNPMSFDYGRRGGANNQSIVVYTNTPVTTNSTPVALSVHGIWRFIIRATRRSHTTSLRQS